MRVKHGAIAHGVLFVVALAACGDDSETPSTSGNAGGAGVQGSSAQSGSSSAQSGSSSAQSGSSSAQSSGSGMAMPPPAFVRLAHLSPEASPMDLCVDFGNGQFLGPLLKINGVANKLSYLDVTILLPLPGGPFTYRAIPADVSSCATPIAGAQDSKIQTSPGQAYTIALVGQSGSPAGGKIEFKAFKDEPVPTSDKLKLRVVHLSPDTPNLDFGTGSDVTFQALFTDVAYGTEGVVTGKTYLEMPSLTNTALSIRQHGLATDALITPPVTLGEGVIATAFVIGDLGGVPKPLKILLCKDNGPKKNYTYTPCSLLP